MTPYSVGTMIVSKEISDKITTGKRMNLKYELVKGVTKKFINCFVYYRIKTKKEGYVKLYLGQ